MGKVDWYTIVSKKERKVLRDAMLDAIENIDALVDAHTDWQGSVHPKNRYAVKLFNARLSQYRDIYTNICNRRRSKDEGKG